MGLCILPLKAWRSAKGVMGGTYKERKEAPKIWVKRVLRDMTAVVYRRLVNVKPMVMVCCRRAGGCD